MQFDKMTKAQIVSYIEEQGGTASKRALKKTLIAYAEELFEKQMSENRMVIDSCCPAGMCCDDPEDDCKCNEKITQGVSEGQMSTAMFTFYILCAIIALSALSLLFS